MNYSIKLTVLSFLTISSLSFAGGDIVSPDISDVAYVPTPEVAHENDFFYVGLGLSAVSARDTDTSLSFTSEKEGQDRLGNISLLAGYNYNEYLALEGRYTTSFTKEDFTEMDGQSIFAKVQYPATEDASVYGLLGYGRVNIDSRTYLDIDESGFQWGLGANYKATDELYVFADYTSLANDLENVDTDAVTVGITYRF